MFPQSERCITGLASVVFYGIYDVLISSLGSVENELSHVYIEMQQWEQLQLVRRTLKHLREIGVRGDLAEKRVALVLGWIMDESEPVVGQVKHL